jgi:radical SAM protein with 4Fe4S-binding SPASM domain
MRFLDRFRRRRKTVQEVLIFEVTARCNHDCLYCYNVWKDKVGYPDGELDTRELKKLMTKGIRETGCSSVSFSGGEPMLRDDIYELADHVRSLGPSLTLLTNGTMIGETEARELVAHGVQLFEIPILSDQREIHDGLVLNPGGFDKAISAIADLRVQGASVVTVFVATRRNLPQWEEVIKLNVALGVDGIMFNRFNPGGKGRLHVDELLPKPDELKHALEIANEASEKYGIGIACSIPIVPCVLDVRDYKNLGHGFCAAGGERAYYTVGPLGHLRMCNHTPSILGNLRESTFAELTAPDKIKAFCEARPEFCAGCAMESTCQGGCKAAAQACTGCLTDPDPFLAQNLDTADPSKVRGPDA